MSATAAPRLRRPPVRRRPGVAVLLPAGILVLALVLAGIIHARRVSEVPDVLRGTVGSLVVFGLTGEALARALTPARLRALAPLLALPFGAVASGLVLTGFGEARVPFDVSLWLTLALGCAASVLVRRRLAGTRSPSAVASPSATPATPSVAALPAWLATTVVLFAVALIPAARYGFDTIVGQNPDATQVVGVANLFAHVPPTGTDVALPLDSVPPAWRFRYPIFYPLTGASSVVHFDPIRVFPVMAAILFVVACLGFALLAVDRLGVPASLGPLVAAVLGFSWVLEQLLWHPYWNQLWGLALFPYALMFGWRALETRHVRDAAAAVLFVFALWFAYPLALPYPLVILGALACAIGVGRPQDLHRPKGAQAWVLAVGSALLLAAIAAGAGLKLIEGLEQILTPGTALWGGDVKTFLPFGDFVGTGGGALPALAVVAVSLGGLWVLPRRPRAALGGILLALGLLDLRFRLTPSGTYMDFKHLSFVGPVVLTLAAVCVIRLLRSRARALTLVGLALGLAWIGAAFALDRTLARGLPEQVSPELFAIRAWADRLPPGASVRVDIPAGGTQLWAVYLLGSHPVDAPDPVLHTTYTHANFGVRADYALELRGTPPPIPAFARRDVPAGGGLGPVLDENRMVALRRIVWPRRLDGVPDTASRRLS